MPEVAEEFLIALRSTTDSTLKVTGRLKKLNHTSSINQSMFDTFTSEHVPMQRSKNMIVNVTCVNGQDDWKSKKLCENLGKRRIAYGTL